MTTPPGKHRPKHRASSSKAPRHAVGTHTGATETNRWLILGICCMSLFIVGIDVSGLNLALPSIKRDLNVSQANLQWVIDAYTVVIASLLMLSGSVADRVGRKKVFRIGLALFGLGSILCAFATSGEFLIVARMVQAVGGSMLNPVAMSIITNTFTEAKERAQAIGMWGAAVGLSMALGPLIGGVLVESIGWQAIFWMNVPIVLIAITMCTIYVPESRAEHPRKFDLAGQLLIMVLLGTMTYGIIEGREDGWTSATVLSCFAAAVAALVLLGIIESRIAQPLINPRFFASWPFSGAVLSAILGFSAQSGFLFLNTLYLQTVRGYSPIHAGLMTLPMAVANAIMAPISGRITGSHGPRLPMVLSGIGIALSGALLTQITPGTSPWFLALAYAIFGVGFGLLNAPITNAAVSGMPRNQAGVASGIASSSRQIGAALGVAIFGTLTFGAMTGAPKSATHGLAPASHSSWWVMTACGIGLALVGLLVTTDAARRSSARVRQEMAVEA